MQQFLVTLIVVWCCAYAVWALLPAGLRRATAQRLSALWWPGPVKRWLRRHAERSGKGCACEGCDVKRPAPGAPGGPPAGEQPIRIHRSLKS